MTAESMSLDDLLQVAQQDMSLSVLLDGLWEKNSPLPKLLLVHRNQLFPRSQDGHEIEFRYIFWDNYQLIPSPDTSVIAIADRMGRIEREQSAMALGMTHEQFFRDIGDLIAYYLIRFVRENDRIKQLVMTEDFSFEQMKGVLKDYSTIDMTFKALMDELSDFESMKDEAVKSRVKRIADLRWLTETFTGLLNMPSAVASSLQTFPLVGHQTKEALIVAQGLTYDEYTAAINVMYASNIFAESKCSLV